MADCVVTVRDVALNLVGSTFNTALCGDLGFSDNFRRVFLVHLCYGTLIVCDACVKVGRTLKHIAFSALLSETKLPKKRKLVWKLTWKHVRKH